MKKISILQEKVAAAVEEDKTQTHELKYATINAAKQNEYLHLE